MGYAPRRGGGRGRRHMTTLTCVFGVCWDLDVMAIDTHVRAAHLGGSPSYHAGSLRARPGFESELGCVHCKTQATVILAYLILYHLDIIIPPDESCCAGRWVDIGAPCPNSDKLATYVACLFRVVVVVVF